MGRIIPTYTLTELLEVPNLEIQALKTFLKESDSLSVETMARVLDKVRQDRNPGMVSYVCRLQFVDEEKQKRWQNIILGVPLKERISSNSEFELYDTTSDPERLLSEVRSGRMTRSEMTSMLVLGFALPSDSYAERPRNNSASGPARHRDGLWSDSVSDRSGVAVGL